MGMWDEMGYRNQPYDMGLSENDYQPWSTLQMAIGEWRTWCTSWTKLLVLRLFFGWVSDFLLVVLWGSEVFFGQIQPAVGMLSCSRTNSGIWWNAGHPRVWSGGEAMSGTPNIYRLLPTFTSCENPMNKNHLKNIHTFIYLCIQWL